MRNTLALVNYNNTERLCRVKSIRKSGLVNVTIYLYANSSICSDYLVAPEQLTYTDIPVEHFTSLAKSYPDYSATDSTSKKLFALQQAADAQYPSIARLRNNYGPYESGFDIIARLQAA